MSENLNQKIDEIDATPVRWKLMGIASMAIALLSMFVEIPVAPFPTPVAAPLEFTPSDVAMMTVFAIPTVWVCGIYMGHMYHRIMTESRPEKGDKSE